MQLRNARGSERGTVSMNTFRFQQVGNCLVKSVMERLFVAGVRVLAKIGVGMKERLVDGTDERQIEELVLHPAHRGDERETHQRPKEREEAGKGDETGENPELEPKQ